MVNIKLDKQVRFGLITGNIDDTLRFSALVLKKEKEYKDSTHNLDMGYIETFKIFKDIPMTDCTKRLVYSDYSREKGWEVFNYSREQEIREVIEYINNRIKINIV